jgi:N6-adenosine-specific RNA methylase IME4/ParB-like chromosome segregation protein Spo0J
MTNAVQQLNARVASIKANADLKPHPATDVLPRMTESEYADLKRDIKANGQQQPILVWEGKILDGRERYRACKALGIQPKTRVLANMAGSAEQMVVSLNVHRRHLAESQKAMVAACVATTSVGSNQTSQGVTQGEAAKKFNTSPDSIQRARKVIEFGNKSLVKAVIQGKLDVTNARRIASNPANAKRNFKDMGKEGLMQVAKMAEKQGNAAKRAARLAKVEAAREGNVPLTPTGELFGLVYADPPWDYLPEATTGYPTMPVEEICALRVPEIVEEDAVLAMWVPPSQILVAAKVVEAWGFEYKTHMVWDKERPGTGQYFMNEHECLFLATRGKPPMPCGKFRSVFSEKRSNKHSEKPEVAYAVLEEMYEGMHKFEMFARAKRAGWQGWGNQYPGNQPVGEAAPKNLPKAATPKVVKGKAANDAKAKPATVSKQGKSVKVANDATFKKAA